MYTRAHTRVRLSEIIAWINNTLDSTRDLGTYRIVEQRMTAILVIRPKTSLHKLSFPTLRSLQMKFEINGFRESTRVFQFNISDLS